MGQNQRKLDELYVPARGLRNRAISKIESFIPNFEAVVADAMMSANRVPCSAPSPATRLPPQNAEYIELDEDGKDLKKKRRAERRAAREAKDLKRRKEANSDDEDDDCI